jgi:predicted peptidase
MKTLLLVTLVFACGVVASPSARHAADDSVDGFVARVYKNRRETMPYRLFIPTGYTMQRTYPLVMWLHGAGGAGTDNQRQIAEDQLLGTHTWTTPANQATHPSFVLVPQSPGVWVEELGKLGNETRLAIEILESVKQEFNVDSRRVYVAGQSNGGFGVWNAIAFRPDLFAAAIPLCGGGDPARASLMAAMPIWAFHGDKDDVIPVAESRTMIAAIKKVGGQPKYTEYKGVDHNVWPRAFKEPGLVDWLFAQHK